MLFSPSIESPGAHDLPALRIASSAAEPGATPVVQAPRLASIDNFRDIADTGNGHPTQHGEHARQGAVYRSNALTASDADLTVLDGLHLSTVFDLRSADEIAQKPDRMPVGANYVSIPALGGDLSGAAAKLSSVEDSRELMREVTRSFVTGETEKAGFAGLLSQIAEREGPFVIHCTAGKDRTGLGNRPPAQHRGGIPRYHHGGLPAQQCIFS
ncbi:tyrosine-protein phosphatase [Nocardia neocaledoniensis]|uniref:tyrosine-protein phosphatase n=1 Tax=Nocardia neocaledoniensis TaxID=236511 RepID=UPI0024553613|nr:tyrosine-protein phosphatase [Nocardia neocaledoniensis]